MKTLAISTLLISVAFGSAPTYAEDQSAKPATPAVAPAKPAVAATATTPAAQAAPEPLTDAQASYRVGLSLGGQLAQSGISADALKSEELARGVRDAMRGAGKLTPDDGKRLNDWVLAARGAVGERNHAAAREFLATNARAEDVVTTASGLEYRILAPGGGASPKPTDEVTVHYRGTLLDGTEFDSSYKRGQPAEFKVNGVIKGWQEALVMMKPGAKWKLFIPPALAYDLSSPPGIPAGSALIFDVQLLSVKRAP